MEGEKYNFAKAQEEADKLRKKVETGDAPNYGEAEKLVEQETKKKEILASQLDLKIDSPLVGALNSLDKDQRDNIIATLSEQALTMGGDYHGKQIAAQVFKSLNYNSFAERIKTPEDFRRYADKVMEVAQLRLKRDEQGKIEGQYKAADSTASTMGAVTRLIRGDFDRDLDTMLQMMRDNPSPDQSESVIGALNSVRGLVRTSEDLERVGQFVKRLSEKGFDAKTYFKSLFGNQFAKNTYKEDANGNDIYEPDDQFKAWQETIADSKKLDDALAVMESAFTHGANPEVFVNGIGRRFVKEATPEQLQQLEEHIATLSEQALTMGGDYHGKQIAAQVFKSLNYNSFAERIKTPEDFRRYADKVMEVAQLRLKRDEQGKIEGQYKAADSTASTMGAVTRLIRGDFDRDLDTMLQMMRDNPSPDQSESVIGALNSVRGLVRTSEDLERVGQFVKRLSEKGFDAKTYFKSLFGNQFAKNTYKEDANGNDIYEPDDQFKAWQETIADSKKLDDALAVMESAFTHGANPEVFVNGIGRRFVKEATPEQLQQLEEHIATLSEQALTMGGDYHGKQIAAQVFKSLNYNSFAERIKTPEDFRRYADKVMEVAQLRLKRDEQGKIEGQYKAADSTASTMGAVTRLIRGDFDRDLDTMLQMMRDNPSPDQSESVIGALNSVRGLVRTSEDLERVGQFVKRLSEKGFDAKTYFKSLFGNQFAKNTYKEDANGNDIYEPDDQFKAWQETIADSKKLDDALAVMESAFTHGANPEVFVKKLNGMNVEERNQFLVLSKKFSTKNIPPQFVADNLPLLQNCDFSKDGLAIFTTFDSQKKWLEYCVQVWKSSPQNIDNIAKFFNEALSLEVKMTSKKEYKVGNIKGLSIDELADIQENVDEELGSAKEIVKPNEQLRSFASKLLEKALDDLYGAKSFSAIANLAPVVNEQYKNKVKLFTLAALTFERADFEHPINFEEISDADYKQAFEIAKSHSPEWQDEQTIAGPFQAGAETFGYKRMLEYIKRKDLSLHDSVHAFRDVLELFRASGLGESEFYGQVLQQVKMDDREYSEGTAHHHLNAIAQTANKNVAEVIAKVQEYKEIERLQELAAAFNTPQAVFASWINLKRYSELEQLLGQTEVFDELKELKAEGKEKLYRYVETLAFHPDSKVNMSAVIQFWRDPESFLAAEASHTPHEVHDRKKPSNYLNMPNLDLTASELRDALVEGKMDGLSAFTPLEVRYTIPLEDIKSEPLHDLVNKALGSSKKGVEEAARNSRKLFSELSKLLKPHGISVIEYIQGKPLPDSVNLPQEIEALLYNRDFGMERPLVKTREFVARISQKSDPEGAIAGDDTVNCMPFGDGKNTVYTFNPNTAQFVIRIVKGDGKERTIAQSVLTKDMDIKTAIPDVITKLQQEGGHLEDILPADILTNAPVYVACDNVEVTPNYSDERHQQIIETIFRDFFREYMSRHATKEGLNPKRIPIGQGYTDALSQLPYEANTFAPQAPVSYSDKTGANVYMLDLTSKKGLDLIWQKNIKEPEVRKRTEATLPKIKGLGYLTFEDTLKVAYIEGKAYADNQSLMQFLFNMENGLIAKDINNSAKDRPNMSLRYTDDSGRMRGYLLAWEGKLVDENIEYNAGEFFGQPCVYIIDVASDRENRMAGGRLIQGFTELYKHNYLDKGKAVPIFAQARESTSYKIVKRQLDKLGKDAGFNFELVELPIYEAGGDVMHPIIIRPVSTRT